jgi:hypothetical protein
LKCITGSSGSRPSCNELERAPGTTEAFSPQPHPLLSPSPSSPGSTNTLRTATSGKGLSVPLPLLPLPPLLTQPSLPSGGMRRVVSSSGTSAIFRCEAVVFRSPKYCLRDSSRMGLLMGWRDGEEGWSRAGQQRHERVQCGMMRQTPPRHVALCQQRAPTTCRPNHTERVLVSTHTHAQRHSPHDVDAKGSCNALHCHIIQRGADTTTRDDGLRCVVGSGCVGVGVSVGGCGCG